MSNEPAAYTISQASKILALGRTSVYAAIKARTLIARKSGRRTLILAADLQRFLNELPQAGRKSNMKADDDDR
jgi:excisionase family DNA binding protein